MVGIVCGFAQKAFASNSRKVETGDRPVALNIGKTSSPNRPVFDKVPTIHSVSYYFNKAIKPGHPGGWQGDKVLADIKQQMDNAYRVIVKNIEKQKVAGLSFTDADFKKFQLPPTLINTEHYYRNRRGDFGPDAVDLKQPADQALEVQKELAAYTTFLNDKLKGLMKDTKPSFK